jgi:hypothetical protein
MVLGSGVSVVRIRKPRTRSYMRLLLNRARICKQVVRLAYVLAYKFETGTMVGAKRRNNRERSYCSIRFGQGQTTERV